MRPFIILRNILILLFIHLLRSGFAQPVLELPQLSNGSDFSVIQKEMNEFFDAHPTAKGSKQWKRREWFLEPRLYPGGQMENLTLKTWKAYDRFMQTQGNDRSTHGAWVFLGPTQCIEGIGRLNSIAFHPTDPNIMYVGSSNGGVWKTFNGGTSWSNVSPNIPLLSVADIKISPSNANVVYILTGDGDPDPSEDNAHQQTEVTSIGILRSPDGGASWYPTNFSFDHPSVVVPLKLLIHPTDVNTQYVASQSGLYKTTDHWATWEIELFELTYDIEFKPGDPDIMYAGTNNEIYRSTDGGNNWFSVYDSEFSNMPASSRVELAVAPNNANVVYALGGNWSGCTGFWQSQSSGENNSWTLQTSGAFSMGEFTQYCVALAVDPNDWTDVFGGMQWINKSTNQGSSWSSIVQDFVHADIHDVAYTNGALWVCCDGGLYKSTNEGASWSELISGLGITEVYRIAGTPENSNLYFMGCQDNGTMRRNGATSIFEHVNGGDGTTCMINYNNWDIVYASSQFGSFSRSGGGGDNGTFSTLTIPGGAGAWISPAILDPIDPDRLFVGKTDVYRSENEGDDWVALNAPAGMVLANCLAQGTSNRNRLYVSSAAAIFRTDNALAASGTTWTSIGAGVPNFFVTGIAVDPANSTHVFVSLSGYSAGDKVFRSYDSGLNWTNLSGSLPNIPVNCIEFHDNGLGNDALYIGTDIGVFYRDNDINNWIYFNNQMPAINVSDLYINPTNNTITAGTYGRGLWRSSMYTACVADITLGSSSAGKRFYSASNSISSSADYNKDIGTETHYKAGNHILLTTNFEAGGYGFFHGKIGPCPDIISEPFTSPLPLSSTLVMDGFKWNAGH